MRKTRKSTICKQNIQRVKDVFRLNNTQFNAFFIDEDNVVVGKFDYDHSKMNVLIPFNGDQITVSSTDPNVEFKMAKQLL